MKAPIFNQEKQDICRDRKERPDTKRKADFAAAQTEQKKKHKKKKAPMDPDAALGEFGCRGLYEGDGGEVRCRCNNKQTVGWDRYNFTRHFETSVHKVYEAEREKEGIFQASLDEMNDVESKKESDRLQAAGTRSTHNVNVDLPFREGFVEMLYSVGIPNYKADKMRPWVENETKRSLTHSSHLSSYVPKLLKKEEDLQEMTLKAVKYIGIIYDATPRQGDFFAMLARFIVLDVEKKRATANQQLIHQAAIKGSLNANTLAGEVSTGLQNRRIKNDQAVVEMVDGCYTNGAAHEVGKNVAAVVGEAERLLALCFSHCASNAGTFM